MSLRTLTFLLLTLACGSRESKRPGPPPIDWVPGVSSSSGPRVPRTQALILINSTPWGALYIDGKLIGNLPQAGVAVVTPGTHMIRIVREGYVPYERPIILDSGTIARITDVVLKEKPASRQQ